MNDNQDKFNIVTDKAKDFVLSEKEKATLFRAVDLHVAKNPIKKIVQKNSYLHNIRWWNYMSTHYSQTVSFAIVAFVILGSSTSYAAQRSLPGELLYVVKVGINEQVRSLLLSDVKKVTFEAERAAERLKEAQVLAVRGELTPRLKTQIETEFDGHVAAVEQKTVEYAQKGEYRKALAVSDTLETILQEQEEGAEHTTFSQKLHSTLQNSLAVRVKTENSIVAATTPTEDIRKVAEDRQLLATELIAQLSEKVPAVAESADDVAATMSLAATPEISSLSAAKLATSAPVADEDIQPQQKFEVRDLLIRAADLVARGDEAQAAGRYNEAFGLYREAQSIAVEVQVLVDLQEVDTLPDTIDEEFE